jgi:RNA binding exosome subunit
MQGAFHWLRVQVFCYATENDDAIRNAIAELVGDEFIEDVVESEHGNRLLVFSKELTKQREFVPLFRKLGKKISEDIIHGIEDRIDDECTLYVRLDKQRIIDGDYRIVHHGDVLSITGKVTAHPAKKEVAVKNLTEFLNSLESLPHPQSQSVPDQE